MLIKMFKNGQGRGAGPVGYLIARDVVAYSDNRDILRDDAGRVVMVARDPMPEVLRGSPARTEALIDATPHEWSYRAGVLSFAPEDRPTERQQIEAMDAFERLAFAGLDPSQRDILWVRHTHEGRVELHFATPRMELSTGRSLNIAPPGYAKTFDVLRDVLNKEHGWADPQDPERARDVVSLIEQARRGQAREVIHDWVLDRIAEGKIQDRGGLVEALTEAGFQIPRAGKDYITALDPESGERLRLRGDVFHEGWTRTGAVERALERHGDEGRSGSGEPDRGRGSRRLDGLDAEELQSRLRAIEQQRADYHRSRYGQARARQPEGRERSDRDDARGPEPDAAADAVRAVGDRDLSDPADRRELRRELVLGAGDDQGRAGERAPGRRDRDLSDAHGRDPASRSDPADAHDLSHPGPKRDRALSGPAPAARSVEPADRAARAHSQTQEVHHGPHRPEDFQRVAGLSSADRAGTRLADLRRAADSSLRGLGDAVRSLGATLDRTDQRAAGRSGDLRQLAAQVSDYVDGRLRQIGGRLGWFLDLAAGLVRGGQGADRRRAPLEPGRDLNAAGAVTAPPPQIPTQSTQRDRSLSR